MRRGLLRSRVARLGAVSVLGAAAVAVAAGCGQSVQNGNVNLIAGKQVFVSKCGSCHTLAHAQTKGTVGPNLDDAFRGALRDGFKRSTVRGVVQHQILYPASNGPMPAKLVTGKTAENVAAYVATVAAAPGSDNGLLASAVKKAGAGKPAVEKAG